MKKLIWVVVIIVVIGGVAWYFLDEPVPQGGQNTEAEALTDKMFEAIGQKAWLDIPYVAWSFRGDRRYVWDKKNHVSEVKWKDYRVILNLDSQKGKVFQGDEKLEGEEAAKMIGKAWSFFANDSFWLNAPAKARDGGTERSVVTGEDGDKQLKVHYTTGGVTPGDTYVWILDQDGLPTAVKMWVSIIPVGGTKATWEGWRELMGAKIATEHKMGPASVDIGDLKVGTKPEDFGLPGDYFDL